MNTKQFLLLGGIVLVLLAILGYFGILGPTADKSALGNNFYLDNAENVAHLLFGVVALAAYFLLKDEQLRKYLVILVGIVALVAAGVGFVQMNAASPNVGVGNLESPLDNLLHLVVAAWAFAAAFMGGKSAAMPSSMPK